MPLAPVARYDAAPPPAPYTGIARFPTGLGMQHAYDSTFMSYTEQSSRQSARTIVALLRGALAIDSVLDIGCARGTWLRAWADAGANDVIGLDGSYVDTATLAIPRERFHAVDLAQHIDLRRQFDLVQSLEVAEHVAATSADTFVDNAVRHSRGIVLFSAAPPGQGGEFHVNEQPYDYWRAKFAAHGFRAHDFVRPRIAGDAGVSFWYRYNTLLYVHDDAAARLPDAIRTSKLADAQPVPDVTPALFRARKALVRMLPQPLQEGLAVGKARLQRYFRGAG